MTAHHSGQPFEGPLNVTVADDGSVKLFFPNGESVCLTQEAAAISSLLLARAALNTREHAARRETGRSRKRPALTMGQVIHVDFAGHSRIR